MALGVSLGHFVPSVSAGLERMSVGLVHVALWAQRRFFPALGPELVPPPCASPSGGQP